jgi:hypothetical protein
MLKAGMIKEATEELCSLKACVCALQPELRVSGTESSWRAVIRRRIEHYPALADSAM